MKIYSFALIAPVAVVASLLTSSCASTSQLAAESYTVDVTATYRERILLTPGHRMTVTVSDVSVADIASPVLARTEIELQPVAPPYRLSIQVPADRVVPNRQYAVSAEIHDADGNLRFTTDTRHSVLTHGASNSVNIVLIGVGRSLE